MSGPARALLRATLTASRRYLVGAQQPWVFTPPAPDWAPSAQERTSLYLHVPFCRHCCPYCPYTKVTYRQELVEPYTRSALAEVDWWCDAVGDGEFASIYIGGGTPTLALDAVSRVLEHVRRRFRVSGDVCIETNPADIDETTVARLHDAGVTLVSLGVQSFRPQTLSILGRDYSPAVAARALGLLARSGFKSVNADLMFAMPGTGPADVTADLARAAELGADQVTCYPLFTFPYSSVGRLQRLRSVRMPGLRKRREQYGAITGWCAGNGFDRVSVWGFKRGGVPRYSSVTRDGYIGIGPGAGSHLADCFVLNTFHLEEWSRALAERRSAVALRMPFVAEMAGWWWLYWRLYDTRIPLAALDEALGADAPKARRWLAAAVRLGLAQRRDGALELSEAGAFWLHLAQNYFVLDYVNTLWTHAQSQPWPQAVAL